MSAQDIKRTANGLRADVLKMVYLAGAGHIAGPLSSAEIIATLYFSDLVGINMDKIILSCGHYVPIQYAALSRIGYIPRDELKTFMQAGGRLPGHPERGMTPGIEVSAGPLGQGVSVATGMALGYKMDGLDAQVYCLVSDGEIQEGQVWEAFNFAVRRQLDNLTFILDRNRIQIGHYISEVATYGNLEGRFESFGLHTLTVDGNDPKSVYEGIAMAKSVRGCPTMIVANTVAGKGVSFMENSPEWHDKTISDEELRAALAELEKHA
jgi:transketolase